MSWSKPSAHLRYRRNHRKNSADNSRNHADRNPSARTPFPFGQSHVVTIRPAGDRLEHILQLYP